MDNTNRYKNLKSLGWSQYFDTGLNQNKRKNLYPARIIEINQDSILIDNGIEEIRVSAKTQGLLPVIGDWVLYRDKTVHEILKRQNRFSSEKSRLGGQQLIAANTDTVFIVYSLEEAFCITHIESYITLTKNSKLQPVIVLTKGDLHMNPYVFSIKLQDLVPNVPIHTVSEGDSDAIEELRRYLAPNRTVLLLGHPGSGKSTLINRLAGRNIQLDDEDSRSLFRIPTGGMIINLPGR